MSAAVADESVGLDEPVRTFCTSCDRPVLVALVGIEVIVAEPFEWEPRAACQSCAWTRARLGRAVDCPRCDNSGYVGSKRPSGPLLAIDVAWSDEGHVRLLGPRTGRRMGEALYELHVCDQSAIVLAPEHERPTNEDRASDSPAGSTRHRRKPHEHPRPADGRVGGRDRPRRVRSPA